MFPDHATPDAAVIRDVRVFDGVRVLEADSVLVRDGVIADVGSGLAASADAELVDGAGGTLLPGLIDAHTHALRVADLEQALVFGVTTELDMFCVPQLLNPLRQAAVSRADVADLRSAGVGATAPDGHPTHLVDMGVYPPFPTIASRDEARRFVADRVAEGSDYLKIFLEDGSAVGWGGIPHLVPETVTALIHAGHEHGLAVVTHVSTGEDARRVVAAGADGLAHLFVDQAPEQEFVDEAAAAGIFVIPTLTIFEQLYDNRRRDANYLTAPRLGPYLSPQVRAAVHSDWRDAVPWTPPAWASTRHAVHTTWLLHEADVPILAGTDVAHPRAAHGLSLHAELAALVDAGLSPVAALTAATAAPADAFGLTDRGRLEAGRRADLLLVAGDPTRDITATRDITGIWRRGQRFDRDAYRATLDTTDTTGTSR